MDSEAPGIPRPVRSAIAELWRMSSHTEESALNSGAFRLLEVNSEATYLAIKGSRLSQKPSSNAQPNELRTALRNFFRWNGAPWYGGPCPDTDETALALHQAFLATEVERTHLAPLDRLDLKNLTQHPHEPVKSVRFGPNEIALLSSVALGQRVRHHALKRFDHWHQFPTEELDNFYWLIVSAPEEAGPIWERTWLGNLHKTWDEIGQIPIFEPTYPEPIEDALFVILLSLIKESKEDPWEPFFVPWVYSSTDDPFADAPRAPDPSALTWTLIVHSNEEFEVPERSEFFKIDHQKIEALERRWQKLQAALRKADTEQANFHPLTKHFFVKALAGEGIDEIVANISCIEATLMLKEWKGRENMEKRYKHLVGNGEEFKWLKRGYALRDKYLHSLADPKGTIAWEDLGGIRWSISKAVDSYLDLTEQRGELSREALLLSLQD